MLLFDVGKLKLGGDSLRDDVTKLAHVTERVLLVVTLSLVDDYRDDDRLLVRLVNVLFWNGWLFIRFRFGAEFSRHL